VRVRERESKYIYIYMKKAYKTISFKCILFKECLSYLKALCSKKEKYTNVELQRY